MNKWSVMKKLNVVLVAVAMSGCASTESSRLYVLSNPEVAPEDKITAEQLAGVQIVLARVDIPKHLDRPSIVTRQADVELAFSEFHRWGEPLADNLTDAIAMNLSALLPTATVVNDRVDHPSDLGYRVQVEILRMTGDLGKQAEFVARWSILDGVDDRVIDRAVMSQTLPLEDDRHGTYVTAVSRLLMDLSRDIAEALQKAAKEGDKGKS